ncbi:spermidine synthase [Amycolatopsis antarctica]|uniref:Polyamine aminopropyltransferase n=1 Tax=Amycolatopsis antarctica TaxID=1854586 RepID=A0A263DAK5_9PSEU|nr:spermidine synthase [Amycolatopsis antarctica]OZM74557.1 spermidine synthase [Amycolatopsis antarctica]
MSSGRTIVEPLGPGLSRVWELGDVLLDTRTDFQHVVIARTAQGVTLFCDDDRQSTEQSQLVYHEALMVPAMLLAEQVRRVLIIGSSEGVLGELALEGGAGHVDHVDIDRVAVRACAEHLPYGYTPAVLDAAERAAADPAAAGIRVHYRDGWEFLAEAAAGETRYDLVVIDLPDENADPEAQHNRLYGKDFLSRCAAVLTPGGVVAAQAGCPTLWRNDTLRAAWARFREMFGTVVYFGSDEHEWAFLSARADRVEDPLGAMLAALTTSGIRPSTVDAEALRGCTVPPYSLRP